MKIKTADLTGAPLDWAVAKCEKPKDPVWNKGTPMPENCTCHCGLYVHPTRRKWDAIHIRDCPYSARYSADWAQGGPIIERECISVLYCGPGSPSLWIATKHNPWYRGSTALEAAMRCYVASKLGGEVDVSEELLP